MVAKSLPIKAGYPSQSNQQLSNMSQNNDRAIYSHISPNDHWHVNTDGFGLTGNKLKDSELSYKDVRTNSLGVKQKA